MTSETTQAPDSTKPPNPAEVSTAFALGFWTIVLACAGAVIWFVIWLATQGIAGLIASGWALPLLCWLIFGSLIYALLTAFGVPTKWKLCIAFFAPVTIVLLILGLTFRAATRILF